MPAAVIPFSATSLKAEFAVLSVHPPSAPSIPFGVLLIDDRGKLSWKLRDDWDDLPLAEEDREYVSYLDGDFHQRVAETSGREFLEWLEDRLSGFLLLSEREAVAGRSATRILERLFAEHVDTLVRPFKTHLPYYPLRAAATKFGEEMDVDPRDVEWLRAPAGLRLSEDLFIVQVVGRSMEPLIPDRSLAVFRRVGAGSRQGKRLLIEELSATASGARFTVKRYTSRKRQTKVDESGDTEWSHETIRLEPLNPEFPAFELDPEAFEGRYRVLGEFVQIWDRDALDLDE